MKRSGILNTELRTVIGKKEKKKTAGPDKVAIEILASLDHFGIDKVTEVLNELYRSGEISDLSRSIFIAFPKQPGANDYKLHRTMILMSHIRKRIMRILMDRDRSRINREIREENLYRTLEQECHINN